MRLGLTIVGIFCLSFVVLPAQGRLDLESLEAKVIQAQTALSQAQLSSDERELRDLRDELGYLRVKSRRGETVTDRERRDLSDRLDSFTRRMTDRGAYSAPLDTRDRSGSNTRSTSGSSSGSNRDRVYDTRNERRYRSVPAGTELDVRLQNRLSSKDAAVEDPVEATTVVDLKDAEGLLIPMGSRLSGYVTSVDRASRMDRKGSVTVSFNRLTVNGDTRDVQVTVVDAIESQGIKGEIGRIGAGAGVGAIIGGIIGGMKGAIAGILIGGGGTVIATEGKDVDLPAGTVLRVRFDSSTTLE